MYSLDDRSMLYCASHYRLQWCLSNWSACSFKRCAATHGMGFNQDIEQHLRWPLTLEIAVFPTIHIFPQFSDRFNMVTIESLYARSDSLARIIAAMQCQVWTIHAISNDNYEEKHWCLKTFITKSLPNFANWLWIYLLSVSHINFTWISRQVLYSEADFM